MSAALHDTIEDTETTRGDLEQVFGADVANLVTEMTDDKSLTKEARKKLQIEHAEHMSKEGELVKFAKKICNLRDVAANPRANWSIERRQKYYEWRKQWWIDCHETIKRCRNCSTQRT